MTDNFFSMSGGASDMAPGAVRYINDVNTQLRLLSGEARLMEASGENSLFCIICLSQKHNNKGNKL